jgi:uncharacterized protein YukE
MSPQAIVNPDDMDAFTGELKEFNTDITDRTSRLISEFRQLGDTWQDQEHQKFAQEFEQTMKVIQHFLQTSEEHVPFLIRKAQRAREYLQQR